jgi:hypothetical protein
VGLLVVKVRRLAPAAVLLELGQTLVGFSSNNGFQFVHNCRRIYPDPFSIQFPLWSAAISWKIAIWQDGQLNGGARDCAQRVWTIDTLH